MDLRALEANYRPYQVQPTQTAQPHVSGAKAALASLLPTIGGAIGAVGGSFVAPVAGTAVGGAAGSAAGEALRQKIMGKGYSAKDIAAQSAFGALPGVFKGVKLGVKAIRGGEELAHAASAAKGVPTAAEQAVKTVIPEATSTRLNPASVVADRQSVIANGKKIAGIAEPTPPAPKGASLLDKMRYVAKQDAAKTASKGTVLGKLAKGTERSGQESKGIVVGASAGRGKVVTPDDAAKLSDFIQNRSKQYGGIRSGKPINQAQDAQNVFNNVKSKLDEALTAIDRPLQQGEHQAIVDAAVQSVSKNAAVTKGTPTLSKFAEKIGNAKSVKELEQIRREADDLAFTQSGAGKTSAAAQAHAVRDAIDGFITPMSTDYKAIKGDYPLARDALNATSKASKDAKGLNIPVIGDVGAQSLSGTKNVLRNASGTVLGKADKGTSLAKPVAKSLFSQMATRSAASLVGGESQPNSSDMTQQTNPMTNPATMTPSTTSNANANILSLSHNNDQNATDYVTEAKNALAQGDYKAFDAIMALAALEDKRASSGANKPLTTTAATAIGNANSGLESLSQLEAMIQNGGVPKGELLPGRSLFGGAVGNAAGTSSYDTAARNIQDVITRLRSGAAITDQEEAFYNSQLPQVFDPPETIQQKLAVFKNLFNSVASRTGAPETIGAAQ